MLGGEGSGELLLRDIKFQLYKVNKLRDLLYIIVVNNTYRALKNWLGR